ncbi:cytochrome P450 [Mycolicibacterium septicum]|uniref:cytochrome P450 n=1 Tax=Mycolicibacterium septicum TaxID=98668 RepID=UPI0023E18359|nr:cytochrome P450 [Mycolicibacterium septicum]MDF3339461.1 cytochrome P450 [Mycolicibacterium septicum]
MSQPATDNSAAMAAGLFPPEFYDDPYPFYAQIRQSAPVMFLEPLNAWILTRFEDVYAAATDEKFGVNYADYQMNRMGPSVVAEPFFRSAQHSMVCNDPPDHTRMRRVFARGFTARRVRELPSFVEHFAHQCLDEAAGNGRIDLVPDYARRVPLAVLSHILGVPSADWTCMEEWVQNYSPVLEVFPMTPSQLQLANEAALGLDDYFRRMVALRRAEPAEDLVTEVLRANDSGADPLSDDELTANLALLYFGGHDTQEKMFGNVINALDAHPDQLRHLYDDPFRAVEAMPELMRYDTVGQFMGRCPTEDMTFGQVTLRKGQTIMLCFGAANRDPEVFGDPDRIDFTREAKPAPNISFGGGRHRCIGANLAMQNLPIMLRVLLQRCPDLRVDHDAAQRHMSMATRGFDALPIEFAV